MLFLQPERRSGRHGEGFEKWDPGPNGRRVEPGARVGHARRGQFDPPGRHALVYDLLPQLLLRILIPVGRPAGDVDPSQGHVDTEAQGTEGRRLLVGLTEADLRCSEPGLFRRELVPVLR